MPILHEIIHFHIGYYINPTKFAKWARYMILGKIGDISYIFELHNTFETSLSTIEHRCRLWLTFANLVLQLDVAYLNDHLTLKQLTEIRTFWKAKVYEIVYESTEMMKTPATDWFQKSFILMY